MKTALMASFFILFLGCASSQIVPHGPDTYLIYREGGTGFSDPKLLRVEAIREANDFCLSKGKEFLIVGTDERRGAPFAYASGEVTFRCLDKDDPDLIRPTLQKEPDTVIRVQ